MRRWASDSRAVGFEVSPCGTLSSNLHVERAPVRILPGMLAARMLAAVAPDSRNYVS